ncbi:MAG TPA: TrmH family RNA methyltransferase [Bacillota bacterium]|nr:TrmH family RNA methyltransferase [Bacillota bacterium]
MSTIKRYRKEEQESYCLGITVSIEYLLNRPAVVNKVYVHSAFTTGETRDKVYDLCAKNRIPIEENDKAFSILSQKENCFVIAMIAKYVDTIDMHTSHVVLVNPSNAGNIGTIIRSATGFGIPDIAIVRPAVDIFDPKVIRASMGALSRVRVEYFDTYNDYKKKTAMVGERYSYPFMLDGSQSLHETTIAEPFSLIFGNEATGLPKEFACVGQPVRIEHGHGIDSLNLPIAASIGLYEATKNHDFEA